jgi:thiamine biosynthesis lipoprotein
VGRQNLVIRDGKLTKLRTDMAIDLGGIAKGYAAGEALKVLKKEGQTSALIDAGGDIYALGLNNGRPWKIGIRQPSGKGILGALELSDASVSTSGDYERFFEKNGVRYHHIFDPRTGYPASGVRSVTVVSKDATLADGYSTALFVLGPERGMKLAESNGIFEAIMITDDRQVLMTPGLAGELRKSE